MEVLRNGAMCPYITHRAISDRLCLICISNKNKSVDDFTECNYKDTRINYKSNAECITYPRHHGDRPGGKVCGKDAKIRIGSTTCVECNYCHGIDHITDSITYLYCTYGCVDETDEKPNIFKAFN